MVAQKRTSLNRRDSMFMHHREKMVSKMWAWVMRYSAAAMVDKLVTLRQCHEAVAASNLRRKLKDEIGETGEELATCGWGLALWEELGER